MTDDTTQATGRPATGTILRGLAAVAVLIGGLVHLQLYFDGYRDFPNANLGRSFVLNGGASVLIAAALFVRRDVIVRLAGIAVVGGTLIAFWLSRTDTGIFGFTERGLEPSPQGALALVAEVAAIVLLAATFVPAIGAGNNVAPRIAAPAAAITVLVAVVGSALWARTPEEPDQVAPADTTAAATSAPATTQPAPTTQPASTTMSMPDDTGGTDTTGQGGQGRSTTSAPADTQPPATEPPATEPPATEPPAPETTMVSIADFNFESDMVEIPVGTTVQWVNNDSFAHTVQANDDSFESETLDEGDVFEFTFDEAGTFDYICGIHPSMTGMIVVTG